MSSQYLQIKSTTSNRDSHGLFDYESSQVTKDSIKVTTSGSLQIKGNLISLISESESPSSEQILRLDCSGSDYVIYPSKQNRVGLVVKHIKNSQKRGHKLSVGDMLRLGRVKLKVQKLCVSAEKDDSGDEFEGSNAGELCCRICFRTHTNPIDPLLAICKCSGSMAYTHIKCLRKWLISKATIKSNVNCDSYRWKHLECEVCKDPLPLTVSYDDKLYNVVKIPTPEKNYIVLEDMRREKYRYIVHLLRGFDSPLLIGRSTDTDVKINDISVSRKHAVIDMHNTNFYLKDCNSKFGTLVMLKKPFLLTKQSEVTLQINRTVLRLKILKDFNTLDCLTCCCKTYNKVDQVPKARTEIHWEEQYPESEDRSYLSP